ncbi:MAG: GHKL domain-containing protein [Deltaproteobacteria bacterium]|nr:GHKL domain-containing protein [Deltaproteobacteria bacterium]
MIEKDYKKLWWKIVLITLSFSLIPLFALGFTIYYQFSVSYQAKVMENLRTLVENRRNALDLFLEERLAQMVTLSKTQSLSRLTDEKFLNKIFTIMQARSKSYIDLGIIDQEGNHIAYVGPYKELKGVNYKQEDWFHSAMTGGVHISDVFLGFRRFPHFIIAVMNREGDKSWIMRATVNSEIIDNIVRGAQIGKKGDAFIVNQRNILQTSPRFHGEIFSHPRTPDFSRVNDTLVEEQVLGGKKALFAAKVIKNTRWILVIREDPEEQLTPLLQARFLAVILMIIGVMLITVGTIFTSRAVMRRLIAVEREKAASEDLMIQSSKMAALGKMAAGIAHEINNPLAVISEKAGWIKDLLAEEDLRRSENLQEFEESVHKIEYHVDRAKKVTHRLLGFARRMEPVQETVNINKTIDDTIDFLENEARYRNIDIQTDYDEQVPSITSDSAQLQQVFLNIINNAIDAIDKDGEVAIRTEYRPKPKEISVKITDNGKGIPKDQLDKIFDPFFTSKAPGKGTGLGLSIIYSILEKLGGRIMVASEVGKGTTFTIYIPAK